MLIVTLTFRSSGELAAAYGLSVTATMVVDSLMAFFVVWRCWGWPIWKAALLMVPLLQIEQAFLAANVLKIPEGGWLPLVHRRRHHAARPHLGARLGEPGQGDAQERGGARMAGAQARGQAPAPGARDRPCS